MTKEYSRTDKIRDVFLVFGSQYFAQARFSSEVFYLPVCVTLFHHSVEMLLKGYLSKTKSLSELKNFGHNLVVLWDEFKEQVGVEGLSIFDYTIKKLDEVELLRYPNVIVDEGYLLNVKYGPPSTPTSLPGMEEVNQYFIDVLDLESIAAEVFKACEVNPSLYFKDAPTEYKNVLPSFLFGGDQD